jgi:hypothetical protein
MQRERTQSNEGDHGFGAGILEQPGDAAPWCPRTDVAGGDPQDKVFDYFRESRFTDLESFAAADGGSFEQDVFLPHWLAASSTGEWEGT